MNNSLFVIERARAEGVPLSLEAEQTYLGKQYESTDNVQYLAKENDFEQLNLEVRSDNIYPFKQSGGY